jgi:Holliday junction resolvase RusA-like endonuclease
MKVSIEMTGKIPSKKNQMMICGRRLVKHRDVRQFELELRAKALQVMTIAGLQATDKPVELHLSVTFGDRRRRDVQNCFGSVCDALNDTVYIDDSQIQNISASKQYTKGIWCYTIIVKTINTKG